MTAEALVHKAGGPGAHSALERSVSEEEWQAAAGFSSPCSTTRRRNTSSPRTGESEYCSDCTSWQCWDTSSGELAKVWRAPPLFVLCARNRPPYKVTF